MSSPPTMFLAAAILGDELRPSAKADVIDGEVI